MPSNPDSTHRKASMMPGQVAASWLSLKKFARPQDFASWSQFISPSPKTLCHTRSWPSPSPTSTSLIRLRACFRAISSSLWQGARPWEQTWVPVVRSLFQRYNGGTYVHAYLCIYIYYKYTNYIHIIHIDLHGSTMFRIYIYILYILYDTHHTFCNMLPSNMPNIVKHLSSVLVLNLVLNMLSNLMHSNSFTYIYMYCSNAISCAAARGEQTRISGTWHHANEGPYLSVPCGSMEYKSFAHVHRVKFEFSICASAELWILHGSPRWASCAEHCRRGSVAAPSWK